MYRQKTLTFVFSLLTALMLTACGGSSSAADQGASASPAQRANKELASASAIAADTAEESTVNTDGNSEQQIETLDSKLDTFVPTISGRSIFENEALADAVETYTISVFTGAYEHYCEILGYDFAYSDIAVDGESFTLTYGITMHYRNQYQDPNVLKNTLSVEKSSEEAFALVQEKYYEEKTSSFLLQLEGLSADDTEFFALYYLPENVLYNKGHSRLPIENILPPVPKTDMIAVSIDSKEYFGSLRLEDEGLLIHTMRWNVDDTADNGYYIDDLEKEISFPLATAVQMTCLYGSSQAKAADVSELGSYLEAYPSSLFWVYVKNGEVIALVEQYRP